MVSVLRLKPDCPTRIGWARDDSYSSTPALDCPARRCSKLRKAPSGLLSKFWLLLRDLRPVREKPERRMSFSAAKQEWRACCSLSDGRAKRSSVNEPLSEHDAAPVGTRLIGEPRHEDFCYEPASSDCQHEGHHQ